jgi:hypothetical protein
MPFSKFKTFLRKVAARTVPAPRRAIRSFIRVFALTNVPTISGIQICFHMTGIRCSPRRHRHGLRRAGMLYETCTPSPYSRRCNPHALMRWRRSQVIAIIAIILLIGIIKKNAIR